MGGSLRLANRSFSASAMTVAGGAALAAPGWPTAFTRRQYATALSSAMAVSKCGETTRLRK